MKKKLTKSLKKDKKIACRNYSYNSKAVSRGTVVSISADRKKIRIKHYKPGHDQTSITKVPATHVQHASNIYVNEDLLNSAQQYGKHLGVGVPPVESPMDFCAYSNERVKGKRSRW